MAMTESGMAEALYSAMEAAYGTIPPEGIAETKKYLMVFATGIVSYIHGNADVLPGSFSNIGGSVSGIGKVS